MPVLHRDKLLASMEQELICCVNLVFIFGGIMLGFSLSQVEKMVVKEDKLIPGAYFWYRQKLFSCKLNVAKGKVLHSLRVSTDRFFM